MSLSVLFLADIWLQHASGRCAASGDAGGWGVRAAAGER